MFRAVSWTRTTKSCSHGLQISLIHFDSYRAHNQVDRENNAAAVFPAHDDAFQPLHRAAVYPDSAPHTQVGVRFDLQFAGPSSSQRLDLRDWQCGGLSVE